MKQQSKTIQKKAFIGILCSVILIFLDQFTKYLAVQHLKDQMPVVLWKNVLELSYLENRWCSVWYFSGKTVASYYFYRDCSDPYHIFLSDAHSFGKTFWLTQWNRHSFFCRCDR